MRFTIALLLALTALVLTTSPVWSDEHECFDYRSSVQVLLDQYKELPFIVMEQKNGDRLETWLNKKTGSWTSLLIRKDGCLVGVRYGKNFTFVFVEPEPEGTSL